MDDLPIDAENVLAASAPLPFLEAVSVYIVATRSFAPDDLLLMFNKLETTYWTVTVHGLSILW
jgi:hypothetical protein